MTNKIHRGNWLVTVSLAAAAAVYFLLAFLPVNKRIGEIEARLEEKQQYVAAATGVAAALVSAEKELADTRAYSARWKHCSPQEKEFHALFGKMSDLAKAAGTTTTRFDPKPVEEHPRLRQIPLAMGCTGKFGQVCHFLSKLEALPVAIWVESLELKRASEVSDSVSCEVKLAIFADNSKNSD